jgi:hypothetical protein
LIFKEEGCLGLGNLYFLKCDNITRKEFNMRKKIFLTTILTVFSILLLLPAFALEAQAADKIGWVGPIYKELSDSLKKGFKAYYNKTYGKDIDITFVRPGGWPVVVDKVRVWDGKPDADIFLGAGAPAHEVLMKEGLLVPYRPKNWDKIPAEWHGMKVKDKKFYWTCFAPWIVTNLYNEKVLKKLRLPAPKTWNNPLAGIWRKGSLEISQIIGGAVTPLLHRQHRYDPISGPWRSSHRSRAAANERDGCAQRWLSRA